MRHCVTKEETVAHLPEHQFSWKSLNQMELGFD
jgi:hypothetical protein